MASDQASSPVEGLGGAIREGSRERDTGGVAPEPVIHRRPDSSGTGVSPTVPWIATFTRDENDRRPRRRVVGAAKWQRARFVAKRLSRLLSSGYRVENEVLYRAWNIILVTPILLLAVPVMAVLAGLILATQGRPVLYRGERLGKDRKPFEIYKFRTLRPDVDSITQNQVLPAGSQMETRLGRILRECRLDELPQLINVVKGSMNLFGPRPVRPCIAQIATRECAGYEGRFSVKPGVFGAAQAIMTHRTPKRLRALYNARQLRGAARVWAEPLIVGMVGISALLRLARMLVDRLQTVLRAGHLHERRKAHRVERTDTTLFVKTGSMEIACGQLVDVNDHAFLFEPDPGVVLSEGEHDFVLRRTTGLFRRPRAARCQGIVRIHPGRRGLNRGPSPVQGYIVFYGPASPLNAYMIDKYFLMNALVP